LKSMIQCRDLAWSPKGLFSLQATDFDIYSGEFLTLLGPSGCGKTSLLRLIGGFVQPDQGDILINGRCMNGVDASDRPVNMVFQNYALFPFMTVAENVGFALRCQGISSKEARPRVSALLAKVGLAGYEDCSPNELSGGQQQRVAIARALINEPSVLLLDEPMSALDYQLRQTLRRELKALQKTLGLTFVMVTHDQEEALSMSDRIVLMREGKIVQIDTPRGLYESPKSVYAAQFIGEANVFSTIVEEVHEDALSVKLGGTLSRVRKPANSDTPSCVHVIIRPEDFQAWSDDELDESTHYLPGCVESVTYKGSTVELQVRLDNGHLVRVMEFFDETDDTLEYKQGEKTYLSWHAGWEVVLADD